MCVCVCIIAQKNCRGLLIGFFCGEMTTRDLPKQSAEIRWKQHIHKIQTHMQLVCLLIPHPVMHL
jgi:hypothetical protein